MAQDRRTLAVHEEELRKRLKMKALGRSSLQRSIARQESRLLWLVEGDAPTKFFHNYTNGRRRKKHIHSLEVDGRLVVDERAKAEAAFQYFDEVLGTPPIRTLQLNLQVLSITSHNLTGLDNHFMEAEVWDVIRSLPPDKAPGPDGFTARFLQTEWPIIRHDVMSAFVMSAFGAAYILLMTRSWCFYLSLMRRTH